MTTHSSSASWRNDRLETLRELRIGDAMRWLGELRGIGPWTCNKVALEGLGHPDAVLAGDFGVPGMVTLALCGKEGGDDEMLAALSPFRPHRARVLRLLQLAHRPASRLPHRKPKVDPHRRFPWRY